MFTTVLHQLFFLTTLWGTEEVIKVKFSILPYIQIQLLNSCGYFTSTVIPNLSSKNKETRKHSQQQKTRTLELDCFLVCLIIALNNEWVVM